LPGYLRDAAHDRDYAGGFFGGLGVLPSSRLAFVVDAAANSGRDSLFDLRPWSLQIGPRVSLFPSRGPIAVHAQFLFGSPTKRGWDLRADRLATARVAAARQNWLVEMS
jgi:hypothetical protein